MIKPLKLDHIGIAVKDIEKALLFYRDTLGLLVEEIEEVPVMKVKVAKLTTSNVIIELVQPLEGETAVAKYIEKRGEGVHHLCFKVADIVEATKNLREQGYKPIYDEPKTGTGGSKVNFLSPKHTFGVLIELIQMADGR